MLNRNRVSTIATPVASGNTRFAQCQMARFAPRIADSSPTVTSVAASGLSAGSTSAITSPDTSSSTNSAPSV